MAEKERKKKEKRNSLVSVFVKGDVFSKLSFIVMGLANIVSGQIIKGLLFLVIEIGFVFYMISSGFHRLAQLITLGTQEQGKVFDEVQEVYIVTQGDNSMLILLYGVMTLVMLFVFIAFWISSIRSGVTARRLKLENKEVPGIVSDIKELFNKNIHRLLLFIPVVGIVVFTITPLIYMILIAFTNYDSEHQPPGNLFHWVGLKNFRLLLSASEQLSSTFWPVLGWTIIWAVVATFSCYFGGMFLAILINSKGIKGKKIWRTIFVTTMGIPSFISLLVVRTMLGENGIINVLLQHWGFTSSALPFLTNGTWAKATVIVVNLWVGIPVTMLMVTGILVNIPGELYESAKIDGAGTVVTFRKITFPYMWFITTPYLITNFIGNINNFGVIYFLTGGNPSNINYYKSAGKTDLLVTWLYKLTKDNKDYNLASTIGILLFIISAVFSLIMYSRSGALKNEEGFQ